MGHPERRRRTVADTVRNPGQRLCRDHDLLGEGAEHAGAGHPVPDGQIACSARDFDDDTRELATDHERRWHADLILVGDEKDIGIVDRRGADPHPDLTVLERLRRLLLDPDDLGRPVLRAHRGAGHA